MELRQLRCFLAVADELHFGRAAHRLQMLPSALGRQIKLLEDDLGASLFVRTTRSVSLTEQGVMLAREAGDLIAKADAIESRMRHQRRQVTAQRFRIGAIDSAAAGLIPSLLHDVRAAHPAMMIQLFEDKTVRLLPKILSGALDLAFVRPPERLDPRLQIRPLLDESAVVAVPQDHALARRKTVSLRDIADEPLIVPDRRSRPHSHDLTAKLFERSGLTPTIAEVADEKQTIVNLVAAQLGAAIVPRWTSRLAVAGVRFVALKVDPAAIAGRLPLAAAWLRGTRDPQRETILAVLNAHLPSYAKGA